MAAMPDFLMFCACIFFRHASTWPYSARQMITELAASDAEICSALIPAILCRTAPETTASARWKHQQYLAKHSFINSSRSKCIVFFLFLRRFRHSRKGVQHHRLESANCATPGLFLDDAAEMWKSAPVSESSILAATGAVVCNAFARGIDDGAPATARRCGSFFPPAEIAARNRRESLRIGSFAARNLLPSFGRLTKICFKLKNGMDISDFANFVFWHNG